MMAVATAAIVLAGSAAAQAQSGTSDPGATGTTAQGGTTSGGGSTGTTTQGGTGSASLQSGSGSGFGDPGAWFGSAFVGSNFAQSTDDASVNFGASIGRLFRHSAGFEFAADFSPKFVLATVPLGENQVNTYMLNFVGAVPVGSPAGFQPFVSAGAGAITLRSNQSQFGGAGFPGIDDNQFAFNVGGGVMAFKSNWGIKADVRYFRGVGNNGNDATTVGVGPNGLDANGNFLLNNVDFWRTNVGLAFRW